MADLSHLVCQAASKPEFGASKLAAYQQAKNLGDATLANQSGCTLDDLIHVRVCMLPHLDYFEEDGERIAKPVHADIVVLAQVLREPYFESALFRIGSHIRHSRESSDERDRRRSVAPSR